MFFFALNQYGLEDLYKFIFNVALDGHPDSISQMFIIPEAIFNVADLQQTHVDRSDITPDMSFDYYSYPWTYGVKDSTFSLVKQNSYSDFTCKNNKCYCYPYNFLKISNNIGNKVIYKYEDFSGTSCPFVIEMSLSVGFSARLLPRSYKGIASNQRFYDEGLPLAKYPTCAWSTDSYISWLTANAVNVPMQITSLLTSGGLAAAGAAAPQAATAAGQYSQGMSSAGAGANLALGVGNLIGQFHQAKLLPNIVNGQNTGDVNFSANKNTFTVYRMRCHLENLKIIDDYFTRFGYKILRVKVPELHSRRYWNYIEIGTGENFAHGDVPQKDLEIINSIAQRGFTVWHSHDAIGNFSLTNSIIV